jgi:hypothetical protein
MSDGVSLVRCCAICLHRNDAGALRCTRCAADLGSAPASVVVRAAYRPRLGAPEWIAAGTLTGGVLGFLVGWPIETAPAGAEPLVAAHAVRATMIGLAAALVGGISGAAARRLWSLTDAGNGAAIRSCPFCAETVRASAVLCRFCGRSLEPAVP